MREEEKTWSVWHISLTPFPSPRAAGHYWGVCLQVEQLWWGSWIGKAGRITRGWRHLGRKESFHTQKTITWRDPQTALTTLQTSVQRARLLREVCPMPPCRQAMWTYKAQPNRETQLQRGMHNPLLPTIERCQHHDGKTANLQWVQPLWKTVGRLLSKLKIELPYDPVIPLLGIYPDKTIIEKDPSTPVFTAGLFTVAKTWKRPKCSSTDEWIKKTWYYIQ